jgi:SP family sugar:H+ symporter-like MFS transporter
MSPPHIDMIEDEEVGNDSSLDASSIDYVKKTSKRTKSFIIAVAAVAAFGGLVFGYDIAGAGGTFLMPGFQEHFGWCQENCTAADEKAINRDQGMINGMFGAGATVGAVGSQWLADKYGRRVCMFSAALTFTVGAALQASAVNMDMMWVARVIAGLGIGSLSMASPVYIAELTPEHARGWLTTLWQLAITFGILVASAANLGLEKWSDGWRISYGGNIVFSVFLMGALLFMPESPRWLVANGREDLAREAMMLSRFPEEVDDEMRELARECDAEKELGVASWSELLSTANKIRYRLFLGIALFAVQQLSGINAIMFYAPTILKRFFGSTNAIIGTFVLNTINFLATFITIAWVDKYGRVLLLVCGGLVMTISLVVNAILSSPQLQESEAVGYLVVVFSAVYIVGFAASWGPLCWVVCAEYFPLRARGKATSITSTTNWLFTTLVGAIFPLASTASLSGCFGFFSAIIFAGSLMVYLFMAETSQRTILEIDEAYADHKPKLIRKLL